METYRIKYALGGGFGGLSNVDWEEIEAESENEAMDYAMQMAMDVYESYAGTNGLASWSDIVEENQGCDESYIDDLYNDEVYSWITYIVEEK